MNGSSWVAVSYSHLKMQCRIFRLKRAPDLLIALQIIRVFMYLTQSAEWH